MKRSVLVIGDAMLDVRRFGRCTRENPENANCKVLDLEARRVELGGAANVARWLAACPNLEVSLLCHFGEDTAGQELEKLCRMAGVVLRSELYRSGPGCKTTVKERICQVTDADHIDHLVRVDQDTDAFTNGVEQEAVARILSDWPLIVVADYRKGVFLGACGRQLMQAIGLQSALKIVNSKCPSDWANVSMNYLICNEKEALQAWPSSADTFQYRWGVMADHVVQTKGAKGATVYFREGKAVQFPSLVKSVVDVTGAGDAFLAGFAHQAMLGTSLWRQLEAGSTWAAHCCGQIGCGMPIGCGESENVNMQLLGWTIVNGLCYDGNPILHNLQTGELAYENLNVLCRLCEMPPQVEAIVRAQL